MELTREQLQWIAQSVPGNAAIYRMRGYRVDALYLSPGLAALNGMTWEEYKKISMDDAVAMVFPEDLPKLLLMARDHSQIGDSFDLYYRVLHKTRGFDWAHGTYRVCGTLDGDPVFVAVFTNASVETDIYQEILDYTDRRVYVCDRHTFDILYANKAAKAYAKDQETPSFRQKCFAFIRDQHRVCRGCWLRRLNKESTMQRKYYNSARGAWEEMSGKFINWCGHDAFVEFVTDVTDNKRQKELIRESQQRYEVAVDGANLAVWEYHIKERQLISTSARIAKYNVPSVLENMPESFLQYFGAAEQEKLIHFFDQIHAGVPVVTGDFWVQWSPDAPCICERACFTVIKDEAGCPDIAYGVSSDVTAQKRQIEQYNQSMALLLAVNPKALGMLHFNLTQNSIIRCYGLSPESEQIFAVKSFDEFVANVSERIHDEEQRTRYVSQVNRQALLEAFAAGKMTQSIVICRADGKDKSIWIRIFYHLLENPDTRDVEGVVYSLDISWEKQRDDIFHIITNQENDLFALIHLKTKTYEIVHVSALMPAALRNALPAMGTCVDFDELRYGLAEQGISPEERASYLQNGNLETIKAALDRDGRYEYMTVADFSENVGGKAYHKMQHYYLNDEKETILVIDTDVTELYRQQQEELLKEKELRRQAVAANSAKTEFLSRMSHDIRTPLNGIMGMAYIAGQEDNPAKTSECLQNIDVSSHFLLGLVNDVLDMAKAESGKIILHKEPYLWDEFYTYLQAVVIPLCEEKGIRFILQVPDEPVDIVPLMDKVRMNQIFFNLLSNAMKFTPSGGQITFGMSYKMMAAGRMSIETIISDSGIGISKAFQPEMFQPFSQELRDDIADNRGSGLGLAIVKRLVDLMGGPITVESNIGEGTKFVITIEYDFVHRQSIASKAVSDQNQNYAFLTGKRALLCEDHPLNQDIAREILSSQGMIVKTARDGKEGVTLFEQSPVGYYDVILMDIRMPVMDGYEAVRAIRALPRKDAAAVPIIAMTADAFAEDVEKCLAVGMNGHIAKPIEVKTLFHMLSQAIGPSDS